MTLQLISWNLWHGLTGKGYVHMGELESPQRRQLRRSQLIKYLHNLSFDIACFQEVNPLTESSRFFSEQLGLQASSQPDNAGLKIGSIGWPTNLSSGLLTLFSSKLKLTDELGIKLSGSNNARVTRFLSLQLSECRYALINKVSFDNNRCFVIVNLHLHHKPEPSKELNTLLLKLVQHNDLSVNQRDDIYLQIEQAESRRRGELEVLFNQLEQMSLKECAGIFLCGDFNVSASNSSYKEIVAKGYQDLSVLNEQQPTWDQENNINVSLYGKNFFSFKFDEDQFSAESLKKIRAYEMRSRKLDYIFYKPLGAEVRESSCQRLGVENPVSDHYGLLTSLVFA